MKRFLLLTLLCAAVGAASAQDNYNKGRVALTSKDTAAAVAAFTDAVKSGQKVAESNFYLGAVAMARGNTPDAIRYLSASVKADDENADALKMLGDAHLANKDVRSALPQYRLAARAAPKNAEIAASYGLALLEVDSIDAAIQRLTAATLLDANNASVYSALGDAYMKQNVLPLGITNYQKAIELDAKRVATRYKLAAAYEKDRKYREAVNEYRAVQQLDPSYADAYFKEAEIWMRTKDPRNYRNAIEPFRKFTDLRPKDFEGLKLYAQALEATGGDSLAAVIAWRAIAVDSSSQEIWRLYFYALVETKDTKKAESALKSMERRGGLVADDYLRLAKLNYMNNNKKEALAWYMKAYEVDSTQCDIFFNAGSLLMTDGDYAGAAEMFERKIRCDPRSLSAYLNGAACYMQTKSYDRARDLLFKSVELKQDFYQGWLWIARYYTQVDSMDKAVETYDRVLTLIGEPPPADKRKEAGEAHSLKGAAQFTRGQYGRAIDSYRRAVSLGYENAGVQLSLGQAILQTLDPTDRAANKTKVEDATKSFRRATALEPGNAQAHLWLGQALILARVEGEDARNKQLRDEACAEFAKVLRLDPRNEDAVKAMNRVGCK